MRQTVGEKWFDLLVIFILSSTITIAYTNCGGGFHTQKSASFSSNCVVKPGSSQLTDNCSPIAPPTTQNPWPKPQDENDRLCANSLQASSGAVTIAINARYEQRLVSANGLEPVSGTAPMSNALYRVVDFNSTVLSCGFLSPHGSVTVPVPKGDLQIEVYSLINSNHSKTIIFDQNKNLHRATTQLTISDTDVSTQILSVSVTALESKSAGAFNILQQVRRSNIFLRNQMIACTLPECQTPPNYNTYVVWDKNEEPNVIGFPSTTYSRTLNVNGQKDILLAVQGGNTSLGEDSDEFDNDVVIITYARSLTDIYGLRHHSQSPGNTLGRVLPHIATEIGLSMFIQFSVLNHRFYRDTIGDATTIAPGSFSLDLDYSDQASTTDSTVSISTLGDGNLMGYHLAKMLYDFTTAGGLSGSVQSTTANVMTKIFENFLVSEEYFPSTYSLSLALDSLVGSSLKSAFKAFLNKYFVDKTRNYFLPTLQANTNCQLEIFSQALPSNQGFYEFTNNRFYHINHSGGPLDIDISTVDKRLSTLTYVNFYLSDIDFAIINDPEIRLWESNTKTILENSQIMSHFFNHLPAGHYMLGVQTNASGTATDTGVNYTIYLNSEKMCPM